MFFRYGYVYYYVLGIPLRGYLGRKGKSDGLPSLFRSLGRKLRFP